MDEETQPKAASSVVKYLLVFAAGIVISAGVFIAISNSKDKISAVYEGAKGNEVMRIELLKDGQTLWYKNDVLRRDAKSTWEKHGGYIFITSNENSDEREPEPYTIIFKIMEDDSMVAWGAQKDWSDAVPLRKID